MTDIEQKALALVNELPSPALGGKQTLLKKRMCGVSTSIWGRQLHLAAPCLSPPPSPPALRRSARAKERAKRKDTTHD